MGTLHRIAFVFSVLFTLALGVGCGESGPSSGTSVVEAFEKWDDRYVRENAVTDEALAELPVGVPELDVGPYCKYVTDAGMAQLAKHKDLQLLKMFDTKITDEGLKHIAGLTKLKVLHLGSKKLTDAGIKHLGGLTELEELSVSSDLITEAGLGVVVHLKSLKKLTFYSSKMKADATVHLPELSQLDEISLNPMMRLDDAGVKNYSSLSKIKEFQIGITDDVTDEGARHIANMVGLEKLTFAYQEITDETLEAIKGLPNLKEIFINDCDKLTHEGVAHLAELPQLEKLTIMGSENTSGPGWAKLKNVATLRRLYVAMLSDPDGEHIAAIQQVEDLEISESPSLTNAGLSHLAKMKNLKKLSLLEVGMTSLDPLATMDWLTELRVIKCKVPNEGLAPIAKMTGLTELVLSGDMLTNIDPVGSLPNLTDINLYCPVDDSCIPTLIKIKTLDSIWISETKITKAGAAKLKAAFPQAAVLHDF